ncbi:DUF5819 family protein [Pseudarthrobacter sp. PS3-L1]|uniref:DUF5819 family protein n=1 Tax=Pseudarthrobacter sp. PS3-L1 TaxID=3046207 RepID=UPI0024BBDE34|nr:DUF5819 family protein [Pseudarthrobacter sp. PS3-L1]MDJ0320712.1 DUF5819 family protein [Pseudarthrobacter sp. PS3-L1]
MTTPRIRKLPAAILLIGTLIGGAHIGATLAFTGPDTPLKQSLQPGLNKYFLGPLDQGWNLFAPGAYSQDEYLLVRACVSTADVCAGGSSAGAEFTEWRNVSAEETPEPGVSRILANREHRQSKVVHSRFWPAAAALSPEMRRMAEGNHLDGQPVFGVALDDTAASKDFNPKVLSQLKTYQRMEDTAVGFASLYALREWGGKASMVEVRMRRDAVVPFEKRHEVAADKTQSFMNIGWRSVVIFDEETRNAWL